MTLIVLIPVVIEESKDSREFRLTNFIETVIRLDWPRSQVHQTKSQMLLVILKGMLREVLVVDLMESTS